MSVNIADTGITALRQLKPENRKLSIKAEL